MPYLPVRWRSAALAVLLAAALDTVDGPAAHAGWIFDGTPACTNANLQQNPVIVSDGVGGAIIAWTDFRSGGGDIYGQRFDANGTPLWTADGVSICTASGTQSKPTAARSGTGAVIAWMDQRTSGASDDIYAQRIDGSGVPQWTTNGVPLATGAADQFDPRLQGDLASRVVDLPGFYVVYDNINADEIWAQRVDVTGSGLWSPATTGGVRVSLFGGASSRLLTGVTSDGGAALALVVGLVATWTELTTGATVTDVRVNRVNSSGLRQWNPDVSVSPLAVAQSEGSVAQVGTQTTIVAWKDARNADTDIYAQRIDGSGNRTWLSDGVPVCRAVGAQSRPLVVASTAGTAIVVWLDARSGTGQLYAQRLDANGQPQWGGIVPDGIALCDNVISQTNHQVASDGAGGVIVVWEDHRGATVDIYAQRVDVNGNRLWGFNGVPVSTAAGPQVLPQLVGDGSAGAIVAWQDERTGGDDIYAVRSLDAINVVGVPEAAPAGPRVELVSRNPGPGPVRLALDLAAAARVSAAVFDVSGRRLDTLAADAPWAAGPHQLQWDGRDASGRPAPRGLYFVRVEAGETGRTIKVTKLD